MKKIFLAALAIVFVFGLTPNAEAFTLNVTSDIHAGKQKTRDYRKYTAGNIIYPKKGESFFKAFLNQPGDMFIALGDNSNTCGDAKKYDQKLAKAVAKSGKQVLFGFGNHDCDKGFKYLSASKYYSVDKEDWRIIVMNSEEGYSNTDGQNDGGFSDTQIDWLKNKLDTDKKIVIAISKPAFKKDLTTKKDTYEKFFEAIDGKKNVKHVLGGDYHVFHETKEYDDVKYHFVQALTLKGSQGRYLKLELS